MCIIIPEFEQQNNKNMVEHGNKKMWVPVRTKIGKLIEVVLCDK